MGFPVGSFSRRAVHFEGGVAPELLLDGLKRLGREHGAPQSGVENDSGRIDDAPEARFIPRREALRYLERYSGRLQGIVLDPVAPADGRTHSVQHCPGLTENLVAAEPSDQGWNCVVEEDQIDGRNPPQELMGGVCGHEFPILSTVRWTFFP